MDLVETLAKEDLGRLPLPRGVLVDALLSCRRQVVGCDPHYDRPGPLLYTQVHPCGQERHGPSPPRVWRASSLQLATTAVEYEQSLPRDLGFILADPTESPKQRVEPSALKSLHFQPPAVLRFIKSSFPDDCLSRLPPELVGQVLVELQSEDVCNLRLASRDVADASFPDNLPQEFWKSRFAPDMEMGFLFARQNPDVLGTVIDWRRLYGFLQVSLRDATLDPGLLNKRRIWMCVGHTCESLVSLLYDERRNWRAWWTPIRGPQLESKWPGPFVQSPSSFLSETKSCPSRYCLPSSHRIVFRSHSSPSTAKTMSVAYESAVAQTAVT